MPKYVYACAHVNAQSFDDDKYNQFMDNNLMFYDDDLTDKIEGLLDDGDDFLIRKVTRPVSPPLLLPFKSQQLIFRILESNTNRPSHSYQCRQAWVTKMMVMTHIRYMYCTSNPNLGPLFPSFFLVISTTLSCRHRAVKLLRS